jgi:hypothetical protein
MNGFGICGFQFQHKHNPCEYRGKPEIKAKQSLAAFS